MGTLDWLVVVILCIISLGVGLVFTRKAGRQGVVGYFTANRNLPWWAIGLSNTSTYQSGNGGFVMLVFIYGLTGNWLWWSAWIVWMPLVAIIWAKMWRRMQIVTTAELITLRYGGPPARVARKIYAFLLFCIAILIIGYITGFFAKTIAPVVPLTECQILLIFGGVTLLYTMLGGLIGVVFTDVVHFFILFGGNLVFFFIAVSQLGGWERIVERVSLVRTEAWVQFPPTQLIPIMSVLILVVQGFFFAGSPTAGEGMTAQRLMSARNERHAMGGQLFNSFLSLSLRTIPLIGLGIVCMSLFSTEEIFEHIGRMPAELKPIREPAHAWGELVNVCRLPVGFVGVLVAAEAAAFMSTLSSLINWGSSFVINDFYTLLRPHDAPRTKLLVSRLTVLALFLFSTIVAICFVEGMVSWFLFINSVMVIFIIPLSWYRFFWWRFNVWGELAAIVLGLPVSILFWFILDFQSKPLWQGAGLLFVLSHLIMVAVTLLTPSESVDTLKLFYERCRPPGLWKRIRNEVLPEARPASSFGSLLIHCLIGMIACFGLVITTNALFVGSWTHIIGGLTLSISFGIWLVRRVV